MRAFALGLASAVVAACVGPTIQVGEAGSGRTAVEARQPAAFTELRARTAIVVDVTIGSPASARVSADDNLLDNVRTVVEGAKLDIRITGNVQPRAAIRVAITMPELTSIEADSAAQVTVTGIDAPHLQLDAQAIARITAEGRAGVLEVRGRSAAVIDLRGLATERADVQLEAASRTWLAAADAVTGTVSSAAVLTLVGAPRNVQVATDSAGRVTNE